MKIGVIGAGATGLAAAYDLTKDSNKTKISFNIKIIDNKSKSV